MNDETRDNRFGRRRGDANPDDDKKQSWDTKSEPRDDSSKEGGQEVLLDDAAELSRSSRARGTLVRFFNFLLTVALLGGIAFFAATWWAEKQFDEPGPLQEETTFEVPRGASFSSIVPGLEAKGIIPRQGPLRVFVNGVKRAGKSSKLKAGEFPFTPGMSMREVMVQVTEGRAIEYSITMPEGWTSYQIMERIQFAEQLTGPLPPIPAEGSLLPNTYSFPRGSTREAVVARMQEAQQKTLAEIWAGRVENLPLKSPAELVTLASIVEKETGVGSERAHVASVFINRLRKGMKLQSDPTIIYGIFGGKGKPKDRPIYRSDISRPTPYNTYTIPGLPPAPIANPGIEALKAVANPLETDDLFFVADGSGGHAFAATLKQHNANVLNWRKVEAQRKKEAKEAAKKAAEDAAKDNAVTETEN